MMRIISNFLPLAFSENSVKDVTSRYAVEWMSKTRKMRVDQDWWSETLELYKTKNWVSHLAYRFVQNFFISFCSELLYIVLNVK